MEEFRREDIRHLLKTFGIQADQAITDYLESQPGLRPLTLRVILEEVTDYDDSPPLQRLRVEIEGQVRR